MKSYRRRVEDCYSLGIHWLAQSEIRDDLGGYKSEYNPRKRRYTVWGGSEDCVLNTAGAVMTLLKESKYKELAVQSARYLQSNIIKPAGFFKGSLASGRGSGSIFPNYLGWVIVALCDTYGETRDSSFLESAATLADWIVEHTQMSDGRIIDALHVENRGMVGKLRDITNRSYSTWHAVLIPALKRTAKLTGDERRYGPFNAKLQKWLERSQRLDGSVRSQYWGAGSALFQALTHGRLNLLANRWDRKLHPTSAVLCLQVFRSMNLGESEKALLKWLKASIGDRGLFYQFYWDDEHSVEEDVMPTVFFAKLLLEYRDPEAEDVTTRALQGIVRSQIRSEDPNAQGGIRGLPGHPDLGDSAFSWDTEFSMMLIQSILQATV